MTSEKQARYEQEEQKCFFQPSFSVEEALVSFLPGFSMLSGILAQLTTWRKNQYGFCVFFMSHLG